MSTILKALRRLEEDQPKNGEGATLPSTAPSSAESSAGAVAPGAADSAISASAATGQALFATDAGAAAQLSARILAEERAAQAAAPAGSGGSDQPEWARLIGPKTTAVAGVILTVILLGSLGTYWLSPSADVTIPIERQVAAVVGQPPANVITPEPEAPREPPARPAPSRAPAAPPRVAVAAQQFANAEPAPPAAAPAAVAKNLSAMRAVKSPAAASPARPPEVLTSARLAERKARAPVQVAVVESRSSAAIAAEAKPAAEVKPKVAAPPLRLVADRRAARPKAAGSTRHFVTDWETAPKVVSSAAPPGGPAAKTLAQDSASKKPSSSASSSPARPAVERISRPDIPAINIVRTAWHPQAERRSARIRFEGSDETIILREGDAVGALVIKEITPSSVLFETGGIEIRRRIGGAPSR